VGRKEIGTLTTYEILLLLDPEQAEARQDDILARTRELVEQATGTWHSHDAWGRRRLAYPITHKEEGVYHLVVFDAEPETLDEVSRVLKIDDAVLRHMATRHIAGSRTSAPRDDAAAVPVPAPAETTAPAESTAAVTEAAEPEATEPETTVSEEAEPEYADAEEEPAEEAPSAEPSEAPGEEEE
jgi:small subunit ribosomal protein S6